MVTVSNLIIVEVNPLPLFGPSGDVTKWTQARRAGIVSKAKRRAPINKRTVKSRANAAEPVGSLRRLITGSTGRPGPLQVSIEVRSGASYSIYVIQGTKSPILAKQQRGEGGRFLLGGRRRTMYVPAGLGYRARFATQVSGQTANDFLSAAVNAEAASHPALLGYDRT